MDKEEREKKHEILNKIANLVKVASALGDSTDDEQTKFIAETMKLVMIAGSDPESAVRFSNHVINYLNETMLLNGQRTAKEHLVLEGDFKLN